MLTPVKILKMWKRVNDRFGLAEDEPKGKGDPKGKEKKPSSKAKQAEKEDERVEKRLTELRVLSKGNLTEPTRVKRFLKSRDKAAKAMKKYCKLLKSNDLKESVQDLTKFRKAVKQLTVVVELLDAKTYSEEDEGQEVDLNTLESVDTSKLDQAMNDPNFGEYSEAELEEAETEELEGEPEEAAEEEAAEEEKEGGPGSIPPIAPPKPPKSDPGAEFKAKLAQWSPAIKTAMAAKGPKAADMAKLLAQATALSKPGGDMALALEKLTECHGLATAGTAPKGDPGAEFKAKLAQWSPAIKTAMAAKGPKAADMAKLLAQATALSKPGGDMPLALEKLTECHGLATAGTAPTVDPAAAFKAKLAEWSPAIKTAMAAKGPKAADMAKLLAQATALSKPGGDIALALEKLTECHDLATAGEAPTVDPAELFKQRVQAFRPSFNTALTQARANNPDLAEELDGMFAQMFDEAKAKKFETALETLEELVKLVNSALKGPAPEEAETEAEEEAEGEAKTEAEEEEEKEEAEEEEETAEPQTPASRWEAERAAAVAKLDAEVREVVATQDPDAARAELELKAVLRQIKAKVETRQQAVEMQRYLDQDEVVADVCELAFDLKTPLLKALGELMAQMPA